MATVEEHQTSFGALFESAGDATAIVSADGTFLQVSASVESLLGYTPSDLIGRSGFDLIELADEPMQRRFLADVVAAPAGTTRGRQIRARHADGSWRTLEPVAINFLADPAIGGILLTFRDVTVRNELETRVRQIERLEAVGQLAGGIAHDFNNVLLVIRGYSSVLRSALGDSELAADVDEISKAADRATDLTRQLLAFARRQMLKPVVVDLARIVLDLENLLRRSVREDIDLQIDAGGDVGGVLADPSQIEQVLLNLVVNARDAMPDGGTIVVSLAPSVLEPGAPASPPLEPGRYVALTVTDTGCGIAESALPYIFEPFFTTKDEGVGTGLGLSTVYGIVAQSGGGIEVATRPEGGTRMTVYLPAAGGVATAEADEPQVSRLPLGNETVLLVEDEDAVRELVRRLLESSGYRVLCAARPSEAQRLAVGERIDLLLTDIVMPEMSGYELATRIRLAQPYSRTLFISGYAHAALADTDDLPEGDLLRKPFSPDELTYAVRAVLDGETLALT